MLRTKDLRIRPKLFLLLLITGLLPLGVVALLSNKLTTKALLTESFNRLIAVQNVHKGRIEDFFHTTFANSAVLAQSGDLVKLMEALGKYETKDSGNNKDTLLADSPQYHAITAPIANSLLDYTRAYHYHDLLLINSADGRIMFSAAGKPVLGSNLKHGALHGSAMASVWQKAMASEAPCISDFAPFKLEGDIESAFLVQPVRSDNGTVIGALALQLTPDLVTRTVDSRKGLGKTGESYLMGYNSDTYRFEFRSNLVTMGDGKYVVGYTLPHLLHYWEDAVKAGTAGGHGVYSDSAGKPVLVAYDRLDLPDLDWYLISKIDQYEVTSPTRTILIRTLLVVGALALLLGLAAVAISRSFTRPIIADMEFAEAVAAGRLDVSLNLRRRDELGDLARSLDHMARNLRRIDWLQSGKELLNTVLRGEHSQLQLAKKCIAFYTKHLDTQLGALYLAGDNQLELKASYAFSDRQGNFNRFELGEGMVGQAALENETILFTDLKTDAPAINYGAGEQLPTTFIAVPITYDGDTMGVMLLGSANGFNDQQRLFIDQNIENTAIMFQTARSRERIEELLATAEEQQERLHLSNKELEEQAESLKESEQQLQTQQEELRVANEELEEQARALKNSKSELQAQQEELRVTNEELEERTRALEQQKDAFRRKNIESVKSQQVVKQKARELEAANRYKSEFLANMSHELRTPLNSILILSQLLAGNASGNLTPKQQESAATIHASGTSLLGLINEILDLSKIEAGKIDLTFEPISPARVVADLERLYREVAADKGLELKMELDEDTPETIVTDEQRLQQILRNLLTNACKFTDQGTVSLHVGRPRPQLVTDSVPDAREALAFTVRDQGIGIPEQHQQAIFEAFRQADGSTSRKYGGTGLGLSISRELAKLLGGTIHLESREGEGSTFTLILPENGRPDESTTTPSKEPAAIQEAPPAPPPSVRKRQPTPTAAEAVVAPADEPPPGQLDDDRGEITADSKSLLIIEDDLEFAKVLRDFGREQGFCCLMADSGEAGLHLAGHYRPSAIILDVGLPGIDGWTVMERLKEHPQLRHIPVHFMSAEDSSLDAMRMGAVGFLTKPVSVEKIKAAIGRLESVVSKPVSRLLLVEDDAIQQESIRQLIGNGDVETTAVATGSAAFAELEKGGYDCMILDLGLSDMSGFELLEKIRHSTSSRRVPIIIYTGRELSRDEEEKLSEYAESIIIKGAKSPERLLDESALFLHRVEANLPEDKRRMLKQVHDQEDILQGKTVLLADDDMRNVFALASVLEERGIEVVIARDGEEALKKLKENEETVQAVLMDIMMPNMDGYEAMRRIRGEERHAKLPIIALTAKAMKGDRTKCIEAGASDYLAKPVDAEKLISMLRVWLYG